MFILSLVLVCVLLLVIYCYNSFVHLQNKVNQAKSSIDVYLTQRFDLIPNLVTCVKAYTNYEESVLIHITELRSRYLETKKLADAEQVNVEYKSLLATAEQYPELKASEQYLLLQKSLAKIENQLQAARRIYNSAVTSYNTSIRLFPLSLLASLFHFEKEPLFEAEDSVHNLSSVHFDS